MSQNEQDEYRQAGRVADFHDEVFATLEANDRLCEILDYDPETEHGPDAKIIPVDAPWQPTHDALVVVDAEPNETSRNNEAHELSFTCAVTFEVTMAWYREDFDASDGGVRFEVFGLISETMTSRIPQTINRRGVEFNRSEPDENFARAWTSVFNYERSALYSV